MRIILVKSIFDNDCDKKELELGKMKDNTSQNNKKD